jgi:hypothetical protein
MSGMASFGAFSWMGQPSVSPSGKKERSPTRTPRPSLEGCFDGLAISCSGSPRKSVKPLGSRALSGSLYSSGKWPHWGTLGRRAEGLIMKPLNFTIRTTFDYREYSTDGDINVQFEDAAAMIEEIHCISKNGDTIDLQEELQDMMVNAIHSSNHIERAGLDLNITTRICMRMFAGEDVDANDIEERGDEYQAALEQLVKRGDPPTMMMVVRSRREIIQHAKALDLMVEAVVVNGDSFSEELILEAHRVLTLGIDNYHRDGTVTPSKRYGGRYRKCGVAAGNTNFAVPVAIQKLMKRLINDFNDDINRIEAESAIDPFFIAAKYSNDFVQYIHSRMEMGGCPASSLTPSS